MADWELGTIGNSAQSSTWLVGVPDPDFDLTGGNRTFRGESILEVKCGTTLLTLERRPVTGIFASGSNRGVGVFGFGRNNAGVYGNSTNSTGVVGEAANTNGSGVLGRNDGGTGVHGQSQQLGWSGVYGQHLGSGYGVVGDGAGAGNAGVLGRTNASEAGAGVRGEGVDFSDGVVGRANNGAGVRGESSGTDGVGVFGWGKSGAKAGIFEGNVDVRGNLTVMNGNKPFKIDHPLDPQNKYLLHNAVEAPERKNVYDGLAQLDEDGTASVDLPEWFEALNGDFRYQLTAVGGAAPNLHVAEEVSGNRFKIAGGEGGMKVCWQVTGSRKDPWASANPFVVEEEKPQEERGRYLQPDLDDAPEEQSVMRARMGEERLPQMMRQEPPQAPQVPQQPGFEPPTAPALTPGAPAMQPDVAAPGFDRMEEEYRREIAQLRAKIEELRRARVEGEQRRQLDDLRRQIEELRRGQ